MSPDRAAELLRRIRSSLFRHPSSWPTWAEVVDELGLKRLRVQELELQGLEFTVSRRLRLGKAIRLLELLRACGHEGASREQLEFMDRFPKAVGVEVRNGAESFARAHELAFALHDALHRLIRPQLVAAAYPRSPSHG